MDEEDEEEEQEEEEEEVKKGAPPSIMTTRPHEQQQQHTCHSTTKCPRNFSPNFKMGKEVEISFFLSRPNQIKRSDCPSRRIKHGSNWNCEFKANFLRPDFYTVVSQIRKSEMGLLRFLFYVAAINEFPAEYLSIIFFETIFRGERTQTWGIILKFK